MQQCDHANCSWHVGILSFFGDFHGFFHATMRSCQWFAACWYRAFWVSFKESSTQTWDWLYHWRHGGIELFGNWLSGVLEHCYNVSFATVALSLSGFKMRAHIGSELRFVLHLQLYTFPPSSTRISKQNTSIFHDKVRNTRYIPFTTKFNKRRSSAKEISNCLKQSPQISLRNTGLRSSAKCLCLRLRPKMYFWQFCFVKTRSYNHSC